MPIALRVSCSELDDSNPGWPSHTDEPNRARAHLMAVEWPHKKQKGLTIVSAVPNKEITMFQQFTLSLSSEI